MKTMKWDYLILELSGNDDWRVPSTGVNLGKTSELAEILTSINHNEEWELATDSGRRIILKRPKK